MSNLGFRLSLNNHFPTWGLHFEALYDMKHTFKDSVAKEEIAHDEQFLLLPQCFQLFSIIVFSHL